MDYNMCRPGSMAAIMQIISPPGVWGLATSLATNTSTPGLDYNMCRPGSMAAVQGHSTEFQDFNIFSRRHQYRISAFFPSLTFGLMVISCQYKSTVQKFIIFSKVQYKATVQESMNIFAL